MTESVELKSLNTTGTRTHPPEVARLIEAVEATLAPMKSAGKELARLRDKAGEKPRATAFDRLHDALAAALAAIKGTDA